MAAGRNRLLLGVLAALMLAAPARAANTTPQPFAPEDGHTFRFGERPIVVVAMDESDAAFVSVKFAVRPDLQADGTLADAYTAVAGYVHPYNAEKTLFYSELPSYVATSGTFWWQPVIRRDFGPRGGGVRRFTMAQAVCHIHVHRRLHIHRRVWWDRRGYRHVRRWRHIHTYRHCHYY